MKIGAITNSFGVQIDGDNLPDLVRDARDRGAKHIELRQTFLGNCETGKGEDWRPVIGNFQSLVDGFPDLSFNLAMAMPCLSGGVDPKGEMFQQALTAAKVVGREAPHLRLVDPAPQDKVWERPGDIPEEALSVADLAREAAAQGITLSVENSGQSIGAIALLVAKCENNCQRKKANCSVYVPTRRTRFAVNRTPMRWATSKRCLWICSRLCTSSRCETGRRFWTSMTATWTALGWCRFSTQRATPALPYSKSRPTKTCSRTCPKVSHTWKVFPKQIDGSSGFDGL